MYNTGEKPGKGTYKCLKCPEKVILNDDNDTLPPCPRCGNPTFTKLTK